MRCMKSSPILLKKNNLTIESTILIIRRIDVEEEVMSKDQPAENQTDRSESDNENEDDVKLD